MASWQSEIKVISNSLKHILEFSDFSDVTFTFGDPPNRKKIKAHKLILAMRSDVFQTMFYGYLHEKDREIVITDIKENIFEFMLKYIYTDEFQLESPGEIIQVYYAAHKYHIPQLMYLCREKIQSKLSGNNACEIFQVALLLEDETLINKCEAIIPRYTKEVLESESFEKLSADALKYLIQQNKLNVSYESDIYKAILKWAKYQVSDDAQQQSIEEEEKEELLSKNVNTQKENCEQIRSLMIAFFPYIKFLSMSLEEFFKLPDLLKVLSKKEIVHVAMNIIKSREVPLPSWCSEERKK
ncbi:BTB/POZ domain-containing protein 6-B-like [Centruroides vittatus]|uniref:BTB/POZ domain-containing protein 6-B-like n=1 Tax=Centruroides vittatus TaxID=120091 RepID=UPI00350F7A4A